MELKYKDYSNELPFEFSCDPDPTQRTDCYGNTISKLVTEDVKADYDAGVQKADRIDYLIAAGCGTLSSALNFLWNKDISLSEASEWGHEKAETIVKKAAKKFGFKSKEPLDKIDIKDAIKFLEDKFPMSGDELEDTFGGSLQHHFRDFTHHPSLIGLVFSILSQFTLRGYGTNTEGRFICPELPYKEHVGKDIPEKILMGTFMWVMHLISDMAGSSKWPGPGTGIPGPLLSTLKEISVLPIVRSVKVKYKDKTDKEMDIAFSQLLSKLFNGTHTYLNQEGKSIRFDLRTEMGITHHIAKGALPVIANEIITRAIFTSRKLYQEIKDNEIKSFRDLKKINTRKILPTNDQRELIRMLTVSSAVFLAITTGVTAVNSAKKSGGSKVLFATNMILNLNYAGIGRFAIAITADSRYIADDVEQVKNRYLERQFLIYQTIDIKMLDCFELDKDGATAMYLLKKQLVNYDITITKNNKKKRLKAEWLNEFSEKETHYQDFDDESDIYRFVADYKFRYPQGFNVILLELSAFDPYYPYEPKDLERFKGISYRKKDVLNEFFKKCPVITKKEFEKFEKVYQKSLADLKQTSKKSAKAAIATVALTAITGGIAWYFAPEIAVLIAGGALTTLHGAALTSASLAMIGGGALAVGGMGMAGGTAIITGGGALICAVGLSTSFTMAVAMSSSKVFTLKECAKILALCETVIKKQPDHEEVILEIKKSILHNMSLVISNIENINEDEKTNDKEKRILIKNSKDSFNYLSRCFSLLD